MLTKRQKQILRELADQAPEMVTAGHIAEQFHISKRTAQTEFKNLKEYLASNQDVKIVSAVAKGTTVIIHDQEKFKEMIKVEEDSFLNQAERVRSLCLLLLQSHHPVSRLDLMNRLYISSSTLVLDLKETEHLLEKFNLILERKSSKGLQISGSERSKRLFIMNLGYSAEDPTAERHQDEYLQKEIEKILVTTFIKYQYRISENLFQNLLIHIYMAIIRMKKGFFIQDKAVDGLDGFESEHKAATEIYDYLARQFFFQVNQYEILNLAVYIKGKSDLIEEEYITEELNNYIVEILNAMEGNYGFEFNQDFDLRLSLAMHVIPLMTRVQYDIQNKNQMLDYIKENFPMAFDMAAFMCMRLQERLQKKINEDEIAYLAIYFNQFLEQQDNVATKQNILIISRLKRSLSILLRQRFLTWFPDKIGLLNIVHVNDVTSIDIESYDVIFTTENQEAERFGAIIITPYPDEKEYSKIKLAIDGFKDKSEVLSLFAEERFFVGNISSKASVLEQLCLLSDKNAISAEELRRAVQLREELGSSYFKNHIALPHPINPMGLATFVSVVLLEKPIVWDEEGNEVQLAMLVSIEKNNAKAFQLWNYLTTIIQDGQLIKKLMRQPDFAYFKEAVSQLLEGYI